MDQDASLSQIFDRKIHEHHRFEHLLLEENVLRYEDNAENLVGCYIHRFPLTGECNYFELKILDAGLSGAIAIGVAPYSYPLSSQLGWHQGSTAYHAADGRLFRDNPVGTPMGPICQKGDIMGCGIRRTENARVRAAVNSMRPLRFYPVEVFFTKNGKEIGKTTTVLSASSGDLYPAVGLHSVGEAVELLIKQDHASAFMPPGKVDDAMLIDCKEKNDWSRTHDVLVSGQTLVYAGKGRSIRDVGMAQARRCLDTTRHYFEVEILDPGQHCYVAVGLVHKNYPRYRHPGWNVGSVAYHADDGQMFVGKGQGVPFGPRCCKGDVMGCGIWFPPNHRTMISDVNIDEAGDGLKHNGIGDCQSDLLGYSDGSGSSSAEEDERVDMMCTDSEHDGFLRVTRTGPNDLLMDRYPNIRLMQNPIRRVMTHKNFSRRHRHHVIPLGCEEDIYPAEDEKIYVRVFFTRNGQSIGETTAPMPKHGFYPAVGMLSANEKVRANLVPLTG